MKNLYLSFFLFFFFFNTTYSANKKNTYDPNVSVQILNIVTNGLVLPNNTISFNGVNDLEIEFDIKTTYIGINPIYFQGNTSAYFYEPNSFDNETSEYYNNGVIPLHLFKNFITLTASGTSYSYTFRKKIHLKKNTVYNTGCSIVFRYSHNETATIPSTTLTKLTYNIIGGTKTSNQPYTPSTASLNLNSISYSNGLPLINNEIIIPESGQESDGEEIATRSVNLSFTFNSIHGSNLVIGYYPNIKVQISGINTRGNYVIKDLSDWFNPTNTNGSIIANNLKIKASDVTQNTSLRIILQFQGMTTYYDCGLIKLSKPIENNTISQNQSIPTEPFTCSQPRIWTSGGNCRNLRIGCNDPKIYSQINTYQWQIMQGATSWANIPGAISKDYTPTNQFSSNTSYRRIAFYNGLYSISLPIVVNSPIVNSICCNQNLPTSISQPQTIIGNIPSISGSFSYQWQIATQQYNPMIWSNITGANGKDYTHIFTSPARRGTNTTTFRRLIIQNGNTINSSNEVIITRSTAIPRLSNTLINNLDNDTKIYPNPVKDILILEVNNDKTIIKDYTVYDATGREIRLNITHISKNKVQIDFSSLPKGTYYIKYEDNEIITKKIIKD